MEIETLLKKLEPLLPDRVRHWHQVRRIAGPQVKPLIEQQILQTAHDVLGDFRNKPLLSLPPKGRLRGKFNVGNILYDKERWPAALTARDLMRNVAIFGMSGSGKTNLVLHLVSQLVDNKVPFLFLDWKRNARQFLPQLKKKVNVYTPGRTLQEFPFNPFICPPDLEDNVYVNHVVDLLAASYTLGEGSKSIMQKALSACYAQGNHAPSIKDILAQVESIPDNERSSKWKISASRALESLEYTRVIPQDRASQEQLVSKLLKEHTIVELDGLTQTGRRFLIPMLCLWLYYVQLPTERREELNHVVIIEEAHNIFHSDRSSIESVMGMLLRQCRELGIGIVVVDQHPSLMSLSVLGNTATTICLNLKDAADRNRAAGLCLLDSSESRWLSMLPVGQGIVKFQDRWRKPFLVQFQHVQVDKGAMTDQLVKEYLQASMTRSGLRGFLSSKFRRKERVRLKDNVLDEGDLGLLRDIAAHLYDAVRDRYKRLGMSADQGTRRKARLVEAGYLTEHAVSIGNTEKIILKLTPTATEILGMGSASSLGERPQLTAESVKHEYWKHYYAELFRERCYAVTIEAPRRRLSSGSMPHQEDAAEHARTRQERASGRVDVLAQRGAETIAIEVETGTSDAVGNVRQNLSARFARVLVVATDETALNKVERQLGKAGLLGVPNRVAVVLRDCSLRPGKRFSGRSSEPKHRQN